MFQYVIVPPLIIREGGKRLFLEFQKFDESAKSCTTESTLISTKHPASYLTSDPAECNTRVNTYINNTMLNIHIHLKIPGLTLDSKYYPHISTDATRYYHDCHTDVLLRIA